MKFNKKEKRILSITLATWGIFLVVSGLIMNGNTRTITNTTYSLNISKKKIAETQAKTNEIKLKDIEIEINNPISVDVKDYLENVETLSASTIKALKLDTSLVNVNQAGTYQYTITYNKKKYIGNVIVKEKELPTFTLKEIRLKVGQSLLLSENAKDYINEQLDEEIYAKMKVIKPYNFDSSKPGEFEYIILYEGADYHGKIIIEEDQNVNQNPKPEPPQSVEGNTKSDTTQDQTTEPTPEPAPEHNTLH